MHNCKWLQDHDLSTSLHLGPFIPCKNDCSSNCNVSTLKCTACLCAKASTCSPTPKPGCKPTRNLIFKDKLNGNQEKILKCGHTQQGDCISVDQYVSIVQGCLPHTLGRNVMGTLVVLCLWIMPVGKKNNFRQLSNNAAKTTKSKSCFEAIAQHKSFNIKAYHTENGIFASAAFKNDCASKHQPLTFSGVGAHDQDRVPGQNIKTISQRLRQVCFMPLTCGQNTPTLNSGPRLLIMLSGYSTASLPLMLASAQTNCGPIQNGLMKILTVLMYLGVPFMSWTQNCKMATRSQSGTLTFASVCLLVSPLCICFLFHWC